MRKLAITTLTVLVAMAICTLVWCFAPYVNAGAAPSPNAEDVAERYINASLDMGASPVPAESTYLQQMFVISVDEFDNSNLVVMEDTNGNTWSYENIDLALDDDIICLIDDNNTSDLVDDKIIRIWVGLE